MPDVPAFSSVHGAHGDLRCLDILRGNPRTAFKAVTYFNRALACLDAIAWSIAKLRPGAIVFGDSVFDANDDQDPGKRTLSRLFANGFPGTVLSLTNGGFSPLMYKNLARMLPAAPAKATTALVEVNMRSFSDEWFIRPEYQFLHSRAVIDFYLREREFSTSFREYFSIQFTDRLAGLTAAYLATRSPVETAGPGNTIGQVLEQCKTDPGSIYRFYYTYPREYIEVRAQALRETLDLLKKKGYAPFVFITPSPYTRLAGADVDSFEANVETLLALLRAAGHEILDLSRQFTDSSLFMDAEHLVLSGRRALCGILLKHLAEGGGGVAHSPRKRTAVNLNHLTRYAFGGPPLKMPGRGERPDSFRERLAGRVLALTRSLQSPFFGVVGAAKRMTAGGGKGSADALAEAAEGMLGPAGGNRGAELLLERGIAEYPESKRLRALLGDLRKDDGDYNRAAEAYAGALRAKDGDLPPGVDAASIEADLAACLWREGRAEQAETMLRRLCDQHPDAVKFRVELAELYNGTLNFEKAIELTREMVRLDPGSEKNRLSLAYLLFRAGRLEEAAEVVGENRDASGGVAALLEKMRVRFDEEFSRNLELRTWLDTIRSDAFPVGWKVGAVVVNCNPFTYGHLYLVEQALCKVDGLYVFVVEEDKSDFAFSDRLRLVCEGTRGFGDRIKVFPSGKFIISSFTFAGYFSKTGATTAANSTSDVFIFGSILAPALGIRHRFVGEEPNCVVTRAYNDTMLHLLPALGVAVNVIPRKALGDAVISASKVRKLLKENDWDGLAALVPPTTLRYLREDCSQ